MSRPPFALAILLFLFPAPVLAQDTLCVEFNFQSPSGNTKRAQDRIRLQMVDVRSSLKEIFKKNVEVESCKDTVPAVRIGSATGIVFDSNSDIYKAEFDVADLVRAREWRDAVDLSWSLKFTDRRNCDSEQVYSILNAVIDYFIYRQYPIAPDLRKRISLWIDIRKCEPAFVKPESYRSLSRRLAAFDKVAFRRYK